MAKSTLQQIVLPAGELHWVNISGQGKQNYNKDGYEYVATEILEGEKALEVKKQIDAFLAANEPKDAKVMTLKSVGYTDLLLDKDGKLRKPNKNGKIINKDSEGAKTDVTDECKPSGKTAFAFRTKTKWPARDGQPERDKKIVVKNGKNEVVNMGERKIGNGTIGRISGNMGVYINGEDYGVSLYLNALQINKYVPYEADDGFEVDEDAEFDNFDDHEDFADTSQDAPAEEEAKTSKPKL